MRAHPRLLSAYTALVFTALSATGYAEGQFVWEALPDLPPAAKEEKQTGLAGLFGGVHEGVLILAGGANFPDAVPWKNGVKTYWNDIYALELDASGKSKWISDIGTKLPKPMAYGASVSTKYGVICIGGADATQCYGDVFLLRWNPETRKVDLQELPSLPVPLAHSTASSVGSVIYVAGGIVSPFAEGTKAFFALDLEPKPDPAPSKNPEEDHNSKAPHPSEGDTDPKTSPPSGTDTDEGNKEDEKSEPSHSPSDAEETTDGADTSSKKPAPDEPENQSDPENDEPKPVKPEVIEEPESDETGKPSEKTAPKDDVTTDDEQPLKATLPLEWKELAAWDGDPRAFAASAAQSDGKKECFFLFSGRNPKPDGTSSLLSDSHKFDPQANQWVRFPDIAPPDQEPRSVVAASAIGDGDRSIFIFGGDDGTMAKVSALIVAASNSTSRDAYLKLNETILENHPGYSRDILRLDTIDGIWTNVATFPEACPVTTRAIRWKDSFILPSGENRPGVRTPKIWKGVWKPE